MNYIKTTSYSFDFMSLPREELFDPSMFYCYSCELRQHCSVDMYAVSKHLP